MFSIRALLNVCISLLLLESSLTAAPINLGKKPRTEAQVKRLADSVRTDPDETARRAAIADLREADPRIHAEVITCLVWALQRDSSAIVRAEAAEAIGQFKLVFPLAGLALEAAAELDSSRAVRDSAQQALWEYHLLGYRSPRGANGIAGQTAEPPIARPSAHHRPPVQAAGGVGVPVPMIMPDLRPPRLAGELPGLASPPAAPQRPMLFHSPILVRRPVLDSLSQMKAALTKGGEKTLGTAIATPEPPLAARRILSEAPRPRKRQTVEETAVTSQPFVLPPITAPPGDLPVIKGR